MALPPSRHPPPPTTDMDPLEAATQASTKVWQADLQGLFEHARERFPDVVWEVGEGGEEVWGHKAVVYARAPPSFQARYFSFRPMLSQAYDEPDNAQDSSLSLSLSLLPPARSPSASPRPVSPQSYAPSYLPSPTHAPSASAAPTRLITTISPSLFAAELEHLYTAKGISGETFDFLFDSASGGDAEQQSLRTSLHARLERLRHDLVFMWRSKLYSDVRISLQGPFKFGDDGTPTMPDEQRESDQAQAAAAAEEEQGALFSTHRFVLVSRSPYFRALLSPTSAFLPPHLLPPSGPDDPPTLTLPSPPFTPPSLHFTLGYLYAGTLSFSHRSYDLSTAFAIYRCSIYLSLPALTTELESRLVSTFSHGLFHARLPLPAFDALARALAPYPLPPTDAPDWLYAGCACPQCTRRAPRLLAFALAPDIHSPPLERGARRALVAHFGPAWSARSFLSLPPKTRSGLAKTVASRLSPQSVVRHLEAVRALREASAAQGYTRELEELAGVVERAGNALVASRAAEVFHSLAWTEALDGVGFSRTDVVDSVLAALLRGLTDHTAGLAYQALVSDVLLRTDEEGGLLLEGKGEVREKVEECRRAVVAWVRRRWVGVRLAGGFGGLEGWCLKEVADELEVQPEDLLLPQEPTHPAPAATKPRLSTRPPPLLPDTSSETPSIASRRPPASLRPSPSPRPSVPRTPSLAASPAPAPAPRPARAMGPRPKAVVLASSRSSVLTTSSSMAPSTAASATTSRGQVSASARSAAPRAPVTSTYLAPAPAAGRPKSLAPSVASQRSTASTVRRSAVGGSSAGAGLKVPRPESGMSVRSADADPGTRVRRVSVAGSTASGVQGARARTASTAGKAPSGVGGGSGRKTVSSVGGARKSVPAVSKQPVPPVPAPARTQTPTRAPSVHMQQPDLPGSPRTVASVSTTASTLRAPSLVLPPPSSSKKRGLTLNVGIPCIITLRPSGRARFRAYARYIGEVDGLPGPWVGVEVRVGAESSRLGGREGDGRWEWNDGSFAGVRYFDVLGSASGEEDPVEEERVSKRRRLDLLGSVGGAGGGGGGGGGGLGQGQAGQGKRAASPAFSEASTAMTGVEGRGMFVRPEQVILVQHAQGL